MSDNYYVIVPEAAEISTDYGVFKDTMLESIYTLSCSIAALTDLDSFSGLGAQAIKDYFYEVHDVLLMLLSDLIGQMHTEFSDVYYSELGDAVDGDKQGKFPSDTMKSVAKHFKRLAEEEAPPIDSLVSQAANNMPSGFSFSRPSTTQYRNGLAEKAAKITNVRKGIARAETDGIAAIAGSDCLASECISKLSEALSFCTNGSLSMASYKSGDFRALTADLGLHDLHMAMSDDQEERSEAVREIDLQVADDRTEYLEIKKQEAAKEKEKWAKWGTALQVVLVGVAIVGVVASGGALAFAFSAVTLVGSLNGLKQRAGQLKAMKKDAGADIGDSVVGDVTKGAKDLKDPLDYLSKVKGTERVYDRGYIDTDTRGSSHLAVGTSFLADLLWDGGKKYLDETVGDDLEGDEKMQYDLLMKGGKKAYSKIVDAKVDNSFNLVDTSLPSKLPKTSKIAGGIGFVAEMGQIVTDHYTEVNDKIIDQCDKGLDKAKSYKESINHPVCYAMDAGW